jgi:hypothetical protein
MRRGHVAWLVIAGLVVWLVPAPLLADDRSVPTRRLEVAERGLNLVVSGSFTDVFDEELVRELSSGVVTTIVVRAYTYREGRSSPTVFSAANMRIVYDLWEEVYLVETWDPRGETHFRRAARADALKDATTLEAFPVALLAEVPPGVNHVVAFVIEVNPVAAELLSEVRRWLTRPRERDLGRSASFFGSFVSVFMNPKIDEADRTLRFKSQVFYRRRR